MFLSDEWHALSFSTKPKGQAIYRLVSIQESFWAGVEEVCAISEPLVKILWLMETSPQWATCMAMDRAKESICAYYEDKGD